MSHKEYRIIYLIIGIAILAMLLALAMTMPEAIEENNTVSFSHASGFYEEAFQLSLDSDGEAIYYTLDCSDPDKNSILYTQPILISDPSKRDNVYSMNRDVSFEFREDLLTRFSVTRFYNMEIPEKCVDKAMVLKAASVDRNGNMGKITCRVYFIGYERKVGYEGINIASIVVDPDDLFDYEKGIYTIGKTFDDALDNNPKEIIGVKPFFRWPANYSQRGSEWERESTLCLFDTSHELTMQGTYGIRIQGDSTRANPKKSFNLFVRENHNIGIPKSRYAPKGDLSENNHDLTLCSSGTDYLLNSRIQGLDITARQFKPCAVFLNGEFWGLYWLTKKNDKNYLAYKYDVSQDDIIQIKTHKLETRFEEDFDLYVSMREYICSNDISNPETLEYVKSMIDIDSYLDYYAVQIYIANFDWPDKNFQLWRTRKKGPGYSDGRWRWIVFDLDNALRICEVENDYIQRAANRDAMFASLLDNQAFSDELYRRLVTLARDNFAPEKMDEAIDEYIQLSVPCMKLDYARYFGDRPIQEYIDSCEDMKTFFRERQPYILKQCETYFDERRQHT